MAQLLSTNIQTKDDEALQAMFAARKSVFIDLLKWDLPALEGRYEVDQFDNEHAHYLILLGDGGRHLASARLLPTTQPHILDTLFPELCEGAVPIGPYIFEITRFCLDRGLRSSERRMARDQLITAIVEHALGEGIKRYTGVAEIGWLQQIRSFGWDCRPLGRPLCTVSGMIGALDIRIDTDTPTRLANTGIWSPLLTFGFTERRAAGANG